MIIALSEDAIRVRIRRDADGAGTEIQPIKREDQNVPPSLRRWTLPIPDDQEEGTVVLTFEYQVRSASSTLFAITSDGAVASGTGTAWYPQVERQDGVRLEGIGTLEVTSNDDVVIGGGTATTNGRFEIASPRYFDFAAASYQVVATASGRTRLYLLRDRPGMEVFAERLENLIGVLGRISGRCRRSGSTSPKRRP